MANTSQTSKVQAEDSITAQNQTFIDFNEKQLPSASYATHQDGESSKMQSASQSTEGAGNINVEDAVPISSVIPDGYDFNRFGIPKQYSYDVTKHKTVADKNSLSKLERKRNWYIKARPRQSGVIDKYYCHLQSDIMCRSQVEVYYFIEYGTKSPSAHLKGMKQGDPNQNADGQKKSRGASLVTMQEVGFYDQVEGFIYRTKTMGCESLLEKPEDKNKGNKKRKGEYLPKESHVADSRAPKSRRIPIYDFEPK